SQHTETPMTDMILMIACRLHPWGVVLPLQWTVALLLWDMTAGMIHMEICMDQGQSVTFTVVAGTCSHLVDDPHLVVVLHAATPVLP
ncbi:hypothetical protein CGJ15_27140, partial [Vibrio parahaemolyticus]